MAELGSILSEQIGLILLICAAVGFYVCARAAGRALMPHEQLSAARLALAHAIPIAATAVVSALMGYGEIAVGVIFGTSVAVMALHVGVVLISATGPQTLPRNRRAWAFLLPAAVLAFMAGFSAQLNWLHAAMLATQGLAILLVWQDKPPPKAPAHPAPPNWIRTVELLLAVVVSFVAAWAATRGIVRISDQTRIASTGLLTATALSPLLILPLIGTGTLLAQHGQAYVGIAVSVLITLMNLCAVLPATIALWYFRATIVELASLSIAPATQPSTAPTTAPDVVLSPVLQPMPYPLAVWRLDTVILIVLGLLLIPLAMRRWTLGRREGVALVFGYVIYLASATLLGRRW